MNPASLSDFRTGDGVLPPQEHVVEAALRRPVVDRVGLIIRVFAQRAATREARLQVCGCGCSGTKRAELVAGDTVRASGRMGASAAPSGGWESHRKYGYFGDCGMWATWRVLANVACAAGWNGVALLSR